MEKVVHEYYTATVKVEKKFNIPDALYPTVYEEWWDRYLVSEENEIDEWREGPVEIVVIK